MAEQRPEGGPTPRDLEEAVRARRRREPRYGAFLVTGALVGVLAAAAVVLVVGAPSATYTRPTVLGYLAVSLGLLGALLGGLAAVLLAIRRR